MKGGDRSTFDHIAIITEVCVENSYIRVAKQNVDNDYWPGNSSRELKLEVVDGCYFIRENNKHSSG